jgi:tetratricopeptide (TPR) repeat protein
MKALSFLLPLLLATPLGARQHDHQAKEALVENLGSVDFPISCAPRVSDAFTRGLALLYSFEYEQARLAFRSVAEKDPACAMAYWGQAMSLYHQLWDRPTKAALEEGSLLLGKAQKLEATPREQDYIRALSVFYSHTGTLDHPQRSSAYAKAMQGVAERYPQDREAQVFYALALLSSAPENDPQHANERAAVAILNKLIEEEPEHPGIAHYIIHACDNPQMASLALPAARRYAAIAPASAHAVHMPSHIFARLGLWQDDIQSNLAAIAVADQMAAKHMHTTHHRVHSMDFLEYAYLQIGDDAKARQQVDQLKAIELMPGDEEFMQDYLEARQSTFPVMYAIERRQWTEALHLQPRPNSAPYSIAAIYWGRAVAAGHLHDARAAEQALARYDELVEQTRKGPKPYLAGGMKQPRKVMAAWAAYAAGHQDQAVTALREVADEQDKVGKGETELPAREMLADLLLDSGQAKEALVQYEISLETDPNRFNGLYGAAQAAGHLEQKDKASSYYAQLLKNCSGVQSDRPELLQARTLLAAK